VSSLFAPSATDSVRRVAAVVGFPLGAATSASKSFEAAEAIRAGASEIDMVMNVGALKSEHQERVLNDIKAVVDAVRKISSTALVKVILETAQLSHAQIVDACLLCALAGAAFVKTSTGFSSAGGASVDAVCLMRAVVGDVLAVKASGGIRDFATASKMIRAGATRLGLSASVAIVEQALSGSVAATAPAGY